MGSEPVICFPAVQSESEREQLADLARRIWEEHYTAIIGADQVTYMLETLQSPGAIAMQMADGRQYHFILSSSEQAGYLAFDRTSDGVFLSKLYLAREFRGQGLARQALNWLRSSTDNVPIRLTVNRFNAGSIAAYQAMGFEITGTQVQDIGQGYVMDDVVMETPSHR